MRLVWALHLVTLIILHVNVSSSVVTYIKVHVSYNTIISDGDARTGIDNFFLLIADRILSNEYTSDAVDCLQALSRSSGET